MALGHRGRKLAWKRRVDFIACPRLDNTRPRWRLVIRERWLLPGSGIIHPHLQLAGPFDDLGATSTRKPLLYDQAKAIDALAADIASDQRSDEWSVLHLQVPCAVTSQIVHVSAAAAS